MGTVLIREVFGIDVNDRPGALEKLLKHYKELGRTLGEELLEPTKIYVREIKKMIKLYNIAGMSHITGGGLIGNLTRILPVNCDININLNNWRVHPIFNLIQEKGNVSQEEMLTTFNCGIGLVIISADEIKEGVLIGEIVEGNKKVNLV